MARSSKVELCALCVMFSKIILDVEEAETNTISVTIDGGTSKDRMKTKKNAVTLHRTTKDFKLKSDTLAVVTISGSQNASDVRTQLKEVVSRFGYREEWKLNMTTDGAPVMVSARAPGRHPLVKLTRVFVLSCLDHTLHLVVEDSIKGVVTLEEAIRKIRALVNYFVQSGKQRQLLLNCMDELGVGRLSVAQGTSNR